MYNFNNIINTLKNENELNNLNIVEKFIYYELRISQDLFNTYGLNFNLGDCLTELLDFNYNLFLFIEKNNDFFLSLLEEVDKIIYDKSFKTNFEIGYKNLDSTIYTLIIIKSLHIIDNIWLLDYANASMLHRNVVYKNIMKHSKVLFLLNENKKIVENVFKIMILLNNHITTKKITIKKKQRKKTKIITEFYLKLSIIHESSYINRLVINFSRIKFKTFGEFHVGASYLTLFENIKKSNWQFAKNNFNIKIINKLTQTPFEFDLKNWKHVKLKIIDYYKKKYNIEIGILENNIKISNIIDELILQKSIILESEIEKYKNYQHSVFMKKKLNGQEDLDYEDRSVKHDNDFLYWNNKLMLNNNIKTIQTDIQKIYYFLMIEKIIDLNFPLYLPHFYDFRGRFYPNSAIGFERLKFARPFFKLNGNLNIIDIKNSQYYKKLLNNDIKIDDFFGKHIKNDLDKYFIIILLLELGKINKNKIINAEGTTLQDFTNLGIKLYWEPGDIDVNDLAYYLSIKNSIDYFINNGVFLNVSIIRDSTGSSFQHWGVVLGINEEFLEKLNLNGALWYDIYTLIITMFNKNNNNKYFDIMKNFLNRKYLKKIIMTANYNAGKDLSLENFLSALKEDNMDTNDNLNYHMFIKDFLSFLNEDLFKLIYLEDKKEKLNKIKGDNYTFEIDKENISLIYLKHTDEKKIIKISGVRWIFIRKKLLKYVDERESDVGLPANIIQASDANLARFLIENLNCLSVHDAFAISIFEVHKLMDLANLYFNTHLKRDSYSIFIFI